MMNCTFPLANSTLDGSVDTKRELTQGGGGTRVRVTVGERVGLGVAVTKIISIVGVAVWAKTGVLVGVKELAMTGVAEGDSESVGEGDGVAAAGGEVGEVSTPGAPVGPG